MATKSTLDPDNLPDDGGTKTPPGHDTRSLGPSDSSDSGSDVAGGSADRQLGDLGLDSDTDRTGTGERMGVGKEPLEREDPDIEPDRIVDAEEAGLGSGLDQAEEAQRGETRYGKKTVRRKASPK
jgi:hypothetical protein